jgi:hypothetical protein
MTAHSWSIALNVLKFVGALVTGTAGVIAVKSETKTRDKKSLTPAGRRLLFFAILGLGVTACSQMAEWIKGIYDADETEKRNTALLSEIRRAVTRFETISFDTHIGIPVNDPAFRSVQDDVRELVSENVHAGKSLNGFQVASKYKDDFINAAIRLDPGKANPDLARIVDNTMPEIEFYKTPPDLTKRDRPEPDLKLVVTAKSPSVTGVLNESEMLDRLSVNRSGMDAPSSGWAPSGRLWSIEDLVGSQAVIVFPLAQDRWVAAIARYVISITFYFNHQRIVIDGAMQSRDPARIGTSFTYIFQKKDIEPFVSSR